MYDHAYCRLLLKSVPLLSILVFALTWLNCRFVGPQRFQSVPRRCREPHFALSCFIQYRPMWRAWTLVVGLILLSRSMALTIETMGGDQIDWVINEFGVELFPVVIDAATGARNRIPDFGFSLTFLDAGMFSPSFDLKNVSNTPPFLNATLADASPNVTKTVYITEDGTRVNRTTQEALIYNRLDGEKFLFRVHVDSPEATSWVEYCGFKLPLRNNGIKLTVEWDNFLTHNETTNMELKEPVIYTRLLIRAKTKWTGQINVADTQTWPVGLVLPFPEVQLPRLPGFPAWEDYPSVPIDSNIEEPLVGIISIRDDRVNVNFETFLFAASNYTASPNPSPNGLNPVDVSWQFWPPSEMETFMLKFALTNAPDGIRSTEFPMLFYSRTRASKHLGPKVTWDPDLTVVFGILETDESQMNVPAVVGGVLGGVIAVSLIAIVLIFIIRRRQSAARKETLTRLNGSMEDGSISSRSTTTDRSSSRSSGWDRGTIDNRVEALKST